MSHQILFARAWHGRIARSLLLGLLTLGLQACQDGVTTVTNPAPINTTQGNNYSGPVPASKDVQKFKTQLWDNLRDPATANCGKCHYAGGQGAPYFVRGDDVNLAYSTTLPLVDRNEPKNSRLVTKVGGGHNCWVAQNYVCAETLKRWIEGWVGSGSGSGRQIALEPPTRVADPGASKNFPPDSSLFGSSGVYGLVSAHCSKCHQEMAATPQSPYFASSDIDVAYNAVKAKIDLDNPVNSRLVQRLKEQHNCWDDCTSNAAEMEGAITAMSGAITPTAVDPNLVYSKALRLGDGTVASGGSRYESNLIALYEFKSGSGNTAFDTSGVSPALNLTLSGDVGWVSGWGIEIRDGMAKGTTAASKKLSDLIKKTGEYSIEAWVIPANVTQEGPARIVSYSAGNNARNFTLGQTQYNYDFLQRSSETDGNGQPALSTADADERLQATLQHVVVTYDPVTGRHIYVNGEDTGDIDPTPPGDLNDWDDSFALVLGNETSRDQLWKGKIRLLAIHNQALTPAQVKQNFDAGVGEKFFLLFGVSDLIGLADSYIVFEVSQFDEYSYLFRKPRFISLDPTVTPGNIPLEGMRIGINGKEAVAGQAYSRLVTRLNDTDYTLDGQLLSQLGTVIPLEKGVESDEFFLTFDRLGSHLDATTDTTSFSPQPPEDLPPAPDIGLRTFEEIDASMSVMTGVPRTNAAVQATFDTIKQQLPSSENINGFLSAHQVGVSQLAIEYCSELVDDDGLRTGFFPGFDFTASYTSAFDSTSKRNQIIDPLLTRFIGSGLDGSQPDPAFVRAELNNLLDRLGVCTTNCSGRTPKMVKAACAAVLGSAVTLVQ